MPQPTPAGAAEEPTVPEPVTPDPAVPPPPPPGPTAAPEPATDDALPPHDPMSDTTDVPVVRDDDPPPSDATAPPAGGRLRLDFHAVSDVGRVRKDNQDSGYAGPWLLTVCDGVGGAARGDIASSTTVGELRHLDEPPGATGTVGLLDRITDGLQEAHIAIAAQVDADPAINGTSTTATVALFDGARLGLGHVGDSRAYLLREGELSQLTNDHTFVQSLIDEGRITEAEARVHPHRNLILKALDGLHDVDPDLFTLELVAGDRLFLCSDGACGVLDDPRIAEILSDGSPEAAAFEMVHASLEAGSSDNVTCVVADVLSAPDTAGDPDTPTPPPVVVGAAADLKQRRPRALFRAHRTGDTGELEPIAAEIPEGVGYAIPTDPPFDPEAMRYAPQAPPRFIWARRLLVFGVLVGLVWVVLGTAYWWSQRQYYVGEDDGVVVIYRGVEVPGLSSVYERSSLQLTDLPDSQQATVEDGIPADDLGAAREKVQQLAAETDGAGVTDDNTDSDLGS